MKGLKIINNRVDLIMFLSVFSVFFLISNALPSVMAELDDCHRNCFDQKRQCHEGFEDPFGSKNQCEEALSDCKKGCNRPKNGYRPVRGVQLEFKVKPIIRDIQIFKKKKE